MDQATGRYWIETGQFAKTAITIKSHLAKLNLHLGGGTMLNALTDDDIASMKSKMRLWKPADKEKGKEERLLTNASINRTIGALRAVMNKAKYEWNAAVAEINFEKHFLKEPEHRTRWLSNEEAIALIDAAPAHLKNIIIFALLTGLRFRNIIDLQWEQVRFTTGEILLSVKSHRPGGKQHTVPITPAVHDLLTEIGIKQSGPVFTYKGKAIRHNIRTAFKNAKKAAKISDFRFHDLRHTCASWALNNGASLSQVREMLGHSTIALTSKYAHLEKNAKADAMNKVAAQLRHNGDKENVA